MVGGIRRLGLLRLGYTNEASGGDIRRRFQSKQTISLPPRAKGKLGSFWGSERIGLEMASLCESHMYGAFLLE